ncbi:MAG: hypothetical protein EB079_07765 [Verrucomicrobia bacterium]|nr:hypothetical protein [Verrucomicrobiota bacterium]
MALKALEPLEQFATDVILDRAAGRRAALLKPLLLFLATIYAGIMRLRARFYHDAVLRRYSVGALVISVGNLTVGGTGKTPVVEKLARSLQEAGRRVAILSRGYKSVPKPLLTRLADRFLPGRTPSPPRIVSDGKSVLLDSAQAGDEPFMLARNLPGVAVLVDSDRVKSARHAIRHLHLEDMITGETKPLSYLRGLRVGAVAGIAVPESFLEGLVKLGAEIVYQRSFADHHRFTVAEVENALTRTRARRGLALITTEKDSVRFPPFTPRDIPVLFLRVEINLLDDGARFEDAVRDAIGIRPKTDQLTAA